MSALKGYLEALLEQLDGKDPRRVKKPVKGSIVLLLRDRDTLERATIRVEADAITIHHTSAATSGEPRLVVRGALEDWLAYVERSDAAAATRLEMYGDAGPLATLAATLALQRSATAVRFGRFQTI